MVTYVMRTLSARILLGFAALTITYGAFAVTLVLNLREVEDQASLILRGYVPLALTSFRLARRQEDLKSYLDQGIGEAQRPTEVTRTITTLRNSRLLALNEIVKTTRDLDSLVNTDGKAATEVARQLPVVEPRVDELQQAVAMLDDKYAIVLAAPPLGVPSKSDASFQAAYDELEPARRRAYDALAELRAAEQDISYKVHAVQEQWERRARRTRNWLAENERTIRMGAIYFGIAATVISIVITAWVAVALGPLRRLREGARRIAAGDYGMRISETGPTEIADLAREFNSMGRAVEEREEEKLRAARLAMVGKMAGHLTHEIRNPLSSISLNMELVQDELGDSPSGRELCRAIHKEIQRLDALTETYLSLRGGKPRLAKESLNAIVTDLVGFVRADLGKRGVELTSELDPSDPVGNVDANQLRQCLINLVRNASEAVAKVDHGRVIVRTCKARDHVEISVEDNGDGIPRDAVPRLFDPFYTTKDGGSGLGLALTQQIVHDHGGTIHVASRVGGGTTFTLSVPMG